MAEQCAVCVNGSQKYRDSLAHGKMHAMDGASAVTVEVREAAESLLESLTTREQVEAMQELMDRVGKRERDIDAEVLERQEAAEG